MRWDNYARPYDKLRSHEQTLERERLVREREREETDRLLALKAARLPDVSHTKEA